MNTTDPLTLIVEGEPLQVSPGITVAVALSMLEESWTRHSVQGDRRAPFCGMGVCQECRVSVNGVRRLACQTLCEEKMVIERT